MKRMSRHLLSMLALCIVLTMALCLPLGAGPGLTAYAEGPDDFVFVPGVVPEEHQLEYPTFAPGEGPQADGELPASYGFDTEGGTLRVLGQSAVKNQGNNGTCWVFGSVGALEANLIKNGYGEQNLAEMHIAYATSKYGASESDISNTQQGFNRMPDGGGNRGYFASYMTRGTSLGGAIDEATDPYSTAVLPFRSLDITRERGAVENKTYTARNYLFLTDYIEDANSAAQQLSDRAVIKEAVMDYGAATASMYYTGDAVSGTMDEEYFNNANSAYYYDGALTEVLNNKVIRSTNHLVLIVGWDDNYPAANFNAEHRPPANGAWLVKNSWGPNWGSKGGYFWLSYYDSNFPSVAMAVDGAQEYDREQTIYEYDYRTQGAYSYGVSGYARVYTVESSAESLKSVRTFFASSDINVKVDIITNFIDFDGYAFPTDINDIECIFNTTYPGWYTIDLDELLPLGEAGSKFAVVLHTGDAAWIGRDHINAPAAGTSYYMGWRMYDASSNYSIKAITVPQVVESVTISPATATLYNGEQKQFTATVQGRNNPSTEVIWSVSGNQSAGTTIEDGLLKVAGDEPSGTLTVTATSAADGTKYGSATVTVEAKWFITFLDNHALGGAMLRPVNQGDSMIMPECTFIHPDGAAFLGWSPDPNDIKGYSEYAPGAHFTPTSDLTLYAIWEKLYTLSYDLNGGLGTPPEPQPNLHALENALLSSAEPSHADVDGKAVVFLGWTEEACAILGRSDTLPDFYASGALYMMPESDVTLYALWGVDSNGNGTADALEPKYTLTYNANASNATSPVPAAQSNLLAGEEVTLSTEPMTRADVSGKAVVFIGWSRSQSGILGQNASLPQLAETPFIMPGESVTLYALWGYDSNRNGVADVLEDKYTLTYDPNGGADAPAAQSNILGGSKVTISTASPTHADVNGVPVLFLGWSETQTDVLSKNDTVPERVGSSITMPEHDLTLYAVWGYDANGNGTADVLEPKYTLSYNANGGDSSTLPAPHTGLLSGETVNISDTVPSRVPLGGRAVVFIGWTEASQRVFARNETLPSYYNPGDEYTMPSRNTTLYALWGYDENGNGVADALEDTYTLTYDANGGSDAPAAHTELLSGEEVALSGDMPSHADVSGTPVVFIGWTEAAYGILGKDDDVPQLVSSPYTMPESDVTLYALWGYDTNGNGVADALEDTYTLTYDANGGYDAPAAQSDILAGDTVNLSADAPSHADVNGTPVVFIGWTETETAVLGRIDSVPQLAANSFTMPNHDVTLYAVWAMDENNNGTADVLEPKYTLTYDANGGYDAPSAHTGLLSGDEVTLSSDTPSHANAGGKPVMFLGWTDTANDILGRNDTVPQTVGNTYIMPTDSVTLYALWAYDENGNSIADALETKYTLSYNANGGSGAPESVTDLLTDETLTLSSSVPAHAPVSDHAVVFIGWTEDDAYSIFGRNDTVPHVFGRAEAFIMPDSDVTLYAVWGMDENGNGKADALEPKYTLTYGANGGSSSSLPAAHTLLLSGERISLSELVPTHASQGWRKIIFIGWSETRDGRIFARNGALPTYYESGSEYTMSGSNRTLYALWGYDINDNGTPDILDSKYTLSYDVGSGEGVPAGLADLLAGETVSLTVDEPTHPDEDGRPIAFIGWVENGPSRIYNRRDAIPTYYESGADYVMPEGDTVLYALWSRDENDNGVPDIWEDTYTLRYDAGSGEGAPAPHGGLLGEETVTLSPSVPVHADENGDAVVFIGWCAEAPDGIYGADAALPAYVNPGTGYSMPYRDVTLYALWGYDANANGTPDALENKYTVTYTDGLDGAVFSDEIYGGLLLGSATPDFAGSVVRTGYEFLGWEPALSETVTGSVTYTARWRMKVYTLSFNAGIGSGYMEPIAVSYGETVTLPQSEFSAPHGRTFRGWNTEPDGTGLSYPAGSTVTLRSSMTLYAVWANSSLMLTNEDGETVDVIKLLRAENMKGSLTREPTDRGYDPNMTSSVLTLRNADGEPLVYNTQNLIAVRSMLGEIRYERFTRSGFVSLHAVGSDVLTIRDGARVYLTLTVTESEDGYIQLQIRSENSAAVRLTFIDGYELLVVTPGDIDFNGSVDANDWAHIMLTCAEALDYDPKAGKDVTVNGHTYNLWVLMADMDSTDVNADFINSITANDWATLMYILAEAWL